MNFSKFLYDWNKSLSEEKAILAISDHKDPIIRINNFLDKISSVWNQEDFHKEFIQNYIVKKEKIPYSTYKLEQDILFRQGYGKIEITDGFITKKNSQIIEDQTNSLKSWLDYLTGTDANYPVWVKVWIIFSFVKMGQLEKEMSEDGTINSCSFKTRTKKTVSSFPICNPRAVALCSGALEGFLKNNLENLSTQLTYEEFSNLVKTKSFSKLYAQFLKELPIYSKEGLKNIEGIWVRYPEGSDAKELVQSLQGYTLEWCIANLGTAQGYLDYGDIHIFYSNDPMGNPIVPRLAIRMNGGSKIAETPRGIAPDQNLDPYIFPVLEEKFKEFGSIADEYQKQASDMKFLTEIYQKWENQISLDKNELRFLYEIDGEIQGFGYDRDPRIEEILDSKTQREKKKDLAQIFKCLQRQISLSKEEALSGDIILHWGDLDLRSLKSYEGNFPKYVRGYLDLSSLQSYEGNLPKHVGGRLNLTSLISLNGNLPKHVGGRLNLTSLISLNGNLPKHVKGYLDLRSLKLFEGNLPEYVGGDLNLTSLISLNGNLPKHVEGYLDLRSLKLFEGNLPEYVGGDLNLTSLTSLSGELPKHVKGYLDLRSLKLFEGNLPEYVGGHLNLTSLISLNGNLPKHVGGRLNLTSLISLNGNLPKHVGGELFLYSLTLLNGNLPEYAWGSLYLSSLTELDKNLPEYVGGHLDLESLTALNVDLPKHVGGGLYLNSITYLDKDLPKHVECQLQLNALTSLKGNLPEYVGMDIDLNHQLSEVTKDLFIQKFGDKVELDYGAGIY